MLTQPRPAPVTSLADALVIKNEDLFFLTEADGQVPIRNGHGLGLYFHDCRYLSGYELKLDGVLPDALGGAAGRGFMATLALANPDLRMTNDRVLRKEEIGIQWHRLLEGRRPALHDVLMFHNFGRQLMEVSVTVTFQATFEDIFVVRGLGAEPGGRRHDPTWRDAVLNFLYEGADGLYRTLAVHFISPPQRLLGTTAIFPIRLEPRQSQQVHLDLVVAESPNRHEVEPHAHRRPNLRKHERELERAAEAWLASITRVSSDNAMLEWVMRRSLRDLLVLRSRIDNDSFFAAGVPWFATLFGRDSLITGLQTLAYDPDSSAQTLRLLARYQGQRLDDWRDEEPGKILHELRVGEMARLGLIPHTPYYGSIDATPLFLILIGRHAAWTGELVLFHELRSHIERALEWMSSYGDGHGERYVAYTSRAEKGLANQGWKDSGDAIVNADGSLAIPPIALVELQGYAYLAKLMMAELYDRGGDPDRAERLRREAEKLLVRFNRDFWMPEKQFYALALQKDGKPVQVVTSNPGQALWSGIVDSEKAEPTVRRLMANDMFSGWGIRTLSENEAAYNPLGYHLGTVWPHDNSLIVAGFRRYGYDQAALEVFAALLHAAIHFKDYQLPELFSGFDRRDYDRPISYPVACHPQAWAAGAMPYMVESFLGLMPEAFEHRLRIVRPFLPLTVQHLEVHRLRVGRATVSLSFQLGERGTTQVRVLDVNGHLDVVIEPFQGDSQACGQKIPE